MTTGSSWQVPARIETPRLVVRRYTSEDAEQLAAVTIRNVEHLRRYMEWIAFEPQTVAQRREWIAEVTRKFDAGEDFTLGMFDLHGTFVGGTGFHVRTDPDRLEIGYWIDGKREGEGLVTEAVAALTHVALRIANADLVGVAHAPSNIRSATIPSRLGFVRQAEAADDCFEDVDGLKDSACFKGSACFDDGDMATGVLWLATRETLASEPLASTPLPAIFDAEGARIPWQR
jgi:ribosomal-protein-serine acetyltransferase